MEQNKELALIQNQSTKRLTQLLTTNDKIGFAFEEKNLTIEKAITGSLLKNLQKEISEVGLMTIISTLVLKTANFFNVGKNITEDQAINTAVLILEKYPYETLEDFVMVFKMAKKGELGKVYDRIDPQVIFEWCNQYFEKKAEIREIEHQKFKQKEAKQIENQKARERMRELYKTYSGPTDDQSKKEDQISKQYAKMKLDYLLNQNKEELLKKQKNDSTPDNTNSSKAS